MMQDRVCTVQARMGCLPQAIEFVEAFCRRHQVPNNDCLRLSLMVEELFTNTVTHGHGGDSDAPVQIELDADALHLDLIYTDMAPPFDPLDQVSRSTVHPEADVSERPVGQLGIALVVGMAMRVSYLREEGRNRLQLTLLRQTSDAADT
jgi:anti-sigma regulatory factor (Ser/Thr protein kinase)